MTKMISKLSADMRSMFGDVNARIISLEENLDQKLTHKFNQILDKRVNSEVTKIRKEVNSTVDTLRKDIDQDLKLVEDKLEEISKSVRENRSSPTSPDISRNIIVRNLFEGRNENLKLKVAALFTEGLTLSRIGPFTVERKETKSRRPGVVIVTCKTKANRDEILSAKKKLQFSRQYSDVFINPDMSLQQRIESENIRILVKALHSVNPDLSVRGSRIIDFSARLRSSEGSKTYHDKRESRQNNSGSNRPSRRYNNRASHRSPRDNTNERYNNSDFQRSRR